MKQSKSVNLKTIADAAGVSRMTVSKVLNKSGRISQATRERVSAIAEELKYRPNLLARGMQTGQSKIIGVIMPNKNFYEPIIAGIHDYLTQEQYSMILTWPQKHHPHTEDDEERQHINRLVSLRIDGIITRPTFESAGKHYFQEVIDRGIPLVTVDRKLSKIRSHFVGSNDLQIGRDAANHLLNLGHRHLAIYTTRTTSTSKDRQKGFLEAVNKHPSKTTCQTIFVDQSFGDEPQDKNSFEFSPRPTGIFTVSDHIADAVYAMAKQKKLSIPHDISIIGCGHLIQMHNASPELSSFDQEPYQIGQEAAKTLIQKIRNPEDSHKKTSKRIKATLIAKQSCAAPPKKQKNKRRLKRNH